MMERLTNYYADDSLLEGNITYGYGVKGEIYTDSIQMFDKYT